MDSSPYCLQRHPQKHESIEHRLFSPESSLLINRFCYIDIHRSIQLSTESRTLCKAIQFTQLGYDNIKDTFFSQNVTSREKNILSGNSLQLSLPLRHWQG